MAKGISEKVFERQVKDLAKVFGWRYYHTWRSIHSPAGFPDVVMVRAPRLIFAELKTEIGKLTPDQEAWLEDLRECVKHITLEPVVYKGTVRGMTGEISHPVAYGSGASMIPTLEVYLWRPSQFDEIQSILR